MCVCIFCDLKVVVLQCSVNTRCNASEQTAVTPPPVPSVASADSVIYTLAPTSPPLQRKGRQSPWEQLFLKNQGKRTRQTCVTVCVRQNYVNLSRGREGKNNPPSKSTQRHRRKDGRKKYVVAVGGGGGGKKQSESHITPSSLPPLLPSSLPRGNIAWERSRSTSWLWLMQVVPHTHWNHGSGRVLKRFPAWACGSVWSS